MAKKKHDDRVNDFLRQGAWEEARKLLERERRKDPQNHWLLTQLGVTFYEQRRHEEALPLFLASLKIVADCPLTLWNLAGTLDALGRFADAIRIYTWLLESKKSSKDDPCWESQEWTDVLKTDCMYRLGVCFEHLGKKQTAEHCYRQYVDLLLSGVDGSYAIEEAMLRIRALHGPGKNGGAATEMRKAVTRALRACGSELSKGRRFQLPVFDSGELLGGRGATKG